MKDDFVEPFNDFKTSVSEKDVQSVTIEFNLDDVMDIPIHKDFIWDTYMDG